ncbi:MAG: hypothetical protein HY877_02520 [Deltaproteobacteria bacterium]|nr:hypothetical protein [Deltaproteobacteria bacterium]
MPVFFLCFLFLCLSASIVYAQSVSSKEISLSDWGISKVSDIGFVSVGVLHDKPSSGTPLSGKEKEKLVIYDIRREKPKIPEPSGKRGQVPSFKEPMFLVSHFDRGNTNRLNGYFNAFSRLPSTASLEIGMTPDKNSALSFSYQNKSPGFAGFWIHLFNFRDPPTERIFLDSTPFKYVGFRIRGSKGGEPVVLQLADRKWEKKEDSLPIGDVGSFLSGGKITAEWQVAWVPLEKFPAGIDREELASLVFRIKSNHSGKIFLKDLVFAKEKGEIPVSEQKAIAQSSLQNAMWLWETKKLYGNAVEQNTLVNFCKDHGIRHLFIQIPYEASKSGETWQIQWDFAPMKQLVSLLHQEGIDVHALDGDPHYALTENHGRVLALIRSVIEYNKSAGPKARIIGVRYDNEPYLLPNFGGLQKSAILRQYVNLLGKAKLVTAEGQLEFGVDIPFWFDARNEFYEPVASLGGRSVIEPIIDTVDNIGIMDYRTVAYGADGVIAHDGDELAYASKKGKKVFVGLETVWLPDETLYEFQKQPGGKLAVSIEDLGGGKIRLNLNADKKESATLFQTRSVEVPSSKITFFGKTKSDLANVMDGAKRELSGYSGFFGFAIHSYESYRPWAEKQK